MTRLAGADRCETAEKIQRELPALGQDEVFLVSGTDWPDGLAVSPVAAVDGGLVLLTDPDHEIPAPTQRVLDLLRSQVPDVEVVAVGGPALRSYPGADRAIVGVDRCDTAHLVAHEFPAHDAVVSTGLDWPDALAGSASAGRSGLHSPTWGPLPLTAPDRLPDATVAAFREVGTDPLWTVTTTGDTRAVGAAVEDQVRALLPVVPRTER